MIDRTAAALKDFLAKESAGAIVLIAAAALALLVANSALSDTYFGTLQTPMPLPLALIEIDKPLLKWINDGLMAVFFFLVGLEVKREFLDGQPAADCGAGRNGRARAGVPRDQPGHA